jgi:hypothetical protein
MPTAKQLKEELVKAITENKSKSTYGKNELVDLVLAIYVLLLEKETD